MTSTSIANLKNLGPKSEKWLNAIGVYTLQDLKEMGAVDCCKILKAQGYPASLNLAYAIEGALRDIHWNALPDDVKRALKESINNNS